MMRFPPDRSLCFLCESSVPFPAAQGCPVPYGALHDLLTDAVHPLTELGRQIAGIIDQPRTVVQVQEKLGTLGGYSRATLERELRGLLLCGLVEGACDSIRQRLLASAAVNRCRYTCWKAAGSLAKIQALAAGDTCSALSARGRKLGLTRWIRAKHFRTWTTIRYLYR